MKNKLFYYTMLTAVIAMPAVAGTVDCAHWPSNKPLPEECLGQNIDGGLQLDVVGAYNGNIVIESGGSDVQNSGGEETYGPAPSSYTFSCDTQPSCEQLGYWNPNDSSSVNYHGSCSGLDTLHCPFDTSKVFCTKTIESCTYQYTREEYLNVKSGTASCQKSDGKTYYEEVCSGTRCVDCTGGYSNCTTNGCVNYQGSPYGTCTTGTCSYFYTRENNKCIKYGSASCTKNGTTYYQESLGGTLCEECSSGSCSTTYGYNLDSKPCGVCSNNNSTYAYDIALSTKLSTDTASLAYRAYRYIGTYIPQEQYLIKEGTIYKGPGATTMFGVALSGQATVFHWDSTSAYGYIVHDANPEKYTCYLEQSDPYHTNCGTDITFNETKRVAIQNGGEVYLMSTRGGTVTFLFD